MNELVRLESINPKMVPKVPFQNEFKHARIEEIYDGDTVKIIILFGDVPVRFSLRILGIDTPEIKQGQGRIQTTRNTNDQASGAGRNRTFHQALHLNFKNVSQWNGLSERVG